MPIVEHVNISIPEEEQGENRAYMFPKEKPKERINPNEDEGNSQPL